MSMSFSLPLDAFKPRRPTTTPGHDGRDLTLVSHPLCPYVQRAAIALEEKGVPFRRVMVDLAAKPDWFLRLSPLGRTPVLAVGDRAIFESAAILEYLDDTQSPRLHPADPLVRAEHRGWIEFGSAVLADIAGFYGASSEAAFEAKAEALRKKFGRIEERLSAGRYFGGDEFSLVDCAFAPVFRYFDGFDAVGDFGILRDLPKTNSWREALACRPSVKTAVVEDYEARLRTFFQARGSHLSQLMVTAKPAP